ncbi:uncharacterized protein [Aristolochia californica]|uniref:uncharacterized protein n=1 Tax=Aristolochia californica TaxID=171875 RepID=UPI0035DD3001
MLPKIPKFPHLSLHQLLSSRTVSHSLSLSTATDAQPQKLERIADELLNFNKLELHDYNVLLRLKLGVNRYGPVASGVGSPGGSSTSTSSGAAPAVEKTAFDIKLEKFDAAAKIKIIKEVRTFTDLGLKEAKDLVEKAPVVLKKGVSKEDANSILKKLKELGATAILE